MRPVHVPSREELVDREGEQIIAAAETVISPVLTKKRKTNVTAEKAWAFPCSKIKPF
jgi:hypothetical protein